MRFSKLFQEASPFEEITFTEDMNIDCLIYEMRLMMKKPRVNARVFYISLVFSNACSVLSQYTAQASLFVNYQKQIVLKVS